jgi:predicted nucleic acid-binding protein
VTLTDAGPLVALIDADEADHGVCRAALGQLELPLVTTWPAFTEAMYLLARGGGRPGREALWKLMLTDRLRVLDLSRSAVERAAALMAKYADLPMDLADATLVAVAEERGTRAVFTLDSDFQAYRLHGRQRFDVVPGPR